VTDIPLVDGAAQLVPVDPDDPQSDGTSVDTMGVGVAADDLGGAFAVAGPYLIRNASGGGRTGASAATANTPPPVGSTGSVGTATAGPALQSIVGISGGGSASIIPGSAETADFGDGAMAPARLTAGAVPSRSTPEAAGATLGSGDANIAAVVDGPFIQLGPAPSTGPTNIVQSADNPPGGTVTGAVQAIVVNPASSSTIWIATPNGGIWVTHNGGASWTPLTDKQASLSIASLTLDPTDTTNNTLIAGIGQTSNGGIGPNIIRGGQETGLLYSTNGGTTWTSLGSGTLAGQSVDGVAARGQVILAATFNQENPASTVGGLYRSTNGGAVFSQITFIGGLVTPVTSLVGDPTNTSKLYAAITSPSASTFASTGVYVSSDTGATWTQIFGAAQSNGVISGANQTFARVAADGTEIAIGVVDVSTDMLAGLYLSTNSGSTWTSLAVPATGAQAANNFAIALDPTTQGVVYVTGMSISLSPFTVAAFRVTTAGATSITDANTGNNSSVHADSRAIAFDATGRLILGTDGGIYVRNSPTTSTGDWTSLIGSNLSLKETYSVAFDGNGDRLLIAGQDTGVAFETSPGGQAFTAVDGGDGINAAVNDQIAGSSNSALYESSQGFGHLSRFIVDPNGNVLGSASVNFNTALNPENATITVPPGSTVAAGDVLNLIVNNASLPGGSVTVSYTAQGGDTTTTLATNLAAAVNANSTLSAAGIAAISETNVVTLGWPATIGAITFGRSISGSEKINFSVASQFSAPFILNKIDPSFIVVGTSDVYVTQDTTLSNTTETSDTLNATDIGSVRANVSAISYGTQDNTQAVLAGGTGASRLWLSTAVTPAPGTLTAVAAYAGAAPVSVAFDLRTQQRFYVADLTNLFGTQNEGAAFTTLTSNLTALNIINPTSLDFISNNGVNDLLVGGLDSVANAPSPIAIADSDASGNLTNWRAFGTGLPNTYVSALNYDSKSDTLAVGLYGRGGWVMYDVTSNFSTASVLQFGLANNNSNPDASLLTGSRPLVKDGTGTLTITGTATYTGGSTINGGIIQIGSGAIAGSITGTGTVTFHTPQGALGLSNDTGFSNTLSGFTVGAVGTITDFVDIEGHTVTVSSVTGQGTTNATINLSDGVVLHLANLSATNWSPETASDGTTGTEVFVAVACYCRGTQILTDMGEVPVEELAIGDRVMTLSGAAKSIRWIGRRSYDPRFIAGNRAVLPIRVAAGALAEGVPARDLLVSPEHALYIDGVLVPARQLVNGASVVQAQAVEQIDYFHIELAAHDIIFADGMPAESYVDCDNRGMFHNAGEFAALFPDDRRPAWEFCAPRLEEGSAELPAIRAALLARAEALGRVTLDPDLHLVADGEVVRAQSVAGRVWRFALPAGVRALAIASRRVVPAEMEAASADQRALGVAVERIVLGGGGVRVEIGHDCPDLGEGFHADEGSHRWTDGRGLLPATLLGRLADDLTIEVHLADTELRYRAALPARAATVNAGAGPARVAGRARRSVAASI
jgi:autotransporter-associated beta strand protein